MRRRFGLHGQMKKIKRESFASLSPCEAILFRDPSEVEIKMPIEVVTLSKNGRWLHMFDQIISFGNLFAAWREFRRGKRVKRDVQVFERHVEDELFGLHEELAAGTYRHGSYERFHIFDPKHRIIHKASVRDRIVHHAVYRIVTPVMERSFIFDSYSCRKEKGTHAAVRRLEHFARRVSRNWIGPCWVLKCDVKKFFDTMDHGILLKLLERRISCSKTIELLKVIIKSYASVVDKNAEREREPKAYLSAI